LLRLWNAKGLFHGPKNYKKGKAGQSAYNL
jgi:hypothetical protein